MAWQKSPDWLVTAFAALVPTLPDVARKQMFGYPCAFAAGQMFMGLFEDQLILRLPEAERERFLQEYATALFAPSPGRVMREYALVPRRLIETPGALAPWIARSHAYASGLPPKVKKPPRSRQRQAR